MGITASYLRSLLKTTADLGDWPINGPGSLQLRHESGRYVLEMVTTGTVTIAISDCLTGSGMEDYLLGMIAAHDVERLRNHWKVPTRSAAEVARMRACFEAFVDPTVGEPWRVGLVKGVSRRDRCEAMPGICSEDLLVELLEGAG